MQYVRQPSQNVEGHFDRAGEKIFIGAVAHLEERLHGMEEVAGSIPVSSISYEVLWQI